MTVLSSKEGEISTGSLEGRFESGISKESELGEKPAITRGFSISLASGERDWWDLSSCAREREIDRLSFE